MNLNQKRFAVVSALAATALPSLVLARGHRVEEVEEIPFVVSDSIEAISKTREAVAALKATAAHADVSKVSNSRKVRAGRGKTRNRRYQARRGPLVVYNEDKGLVKAFKNVPGVETANVRQLNLLQLAPGGHLGRFVIFTQSAIAQLDEIYGTHEAPAQLKVDYRLPLAKITNPNVAGIINSTEIQSVVRSAGPRRTKRPFSQKKNPLKNVGVLNRLNPYARVARRQAILNQQHKRSSVSKKERSETKVDAGKQFLGQLLAP